MASLLRYIGNATKNDNGFTLVEVMVAAVLLGLTVSAVAIMIINASALRSSNDHNRQARILAQEELEDPAHHFLNYGVLAGKVGVYQLNKGETSKPSLPSSLNLVVTSNAPLNLLGVAIPSKTIMSTISWTENGRNFSVSLSKRVTSVR